MAKTTVEAGLLDRKIRFEQKSEVRNEYGETETLDWEDIEKFPTPWASVLERDGKEAFEADRNTASASTVFTIRYRTDLNEKMRIVYQSQNYDILSIVHVGRMQLTRIIAMRKDHEFEGENQPV